MKFQMLISIVNIQKQGFAMRASMTQQLLTSGVLICSTGEVKLNIHLLMEVRPSGVVQLRGSSGKDMRDLNLKVTPMIEGFCKVPSNTLSWHMINRFSWSENGEYLFRGSIGWR